MLDVFIDGNIYYQTPLGGIARLFNEILPRICTADNGLRITLISQNQHSSLLPAHAHISYLIVPTWNNLERPPFFVETILGLARYISIRKLAKSKENPIWHSTYFSTAGKWKGPSIVTVHDMIYERFPNLFNTPDDENFRNRKRRCFDTADAIICISETTRQDLEDFYNCRGKLIHVTPLACSGMFMKLQDDQYLGEGPATKPYVIYIGSRVHYKNFEFFVRGYGRWKLAKDVDLFIVGKAWSEEERQLLFELGIQDGVHLSSNLDDRELCILYNGALAFAYPSLFEGFGIPLLEAMACECPILASRIPSTIEVAGDYPIYFEPTDLESLADALDRVVSLGKESSRLEYGHDRLKLYSWDKTAEETLKVYHFFDH